MLSLESIERANDVAAHKARKAKKEPLTFFDEAEVERTMDKRPIPFPLLGNHVPKGWELVDTLLCDHSGCGLPSEPAYTLSQLAVRIRSDVADGNLYGYAITSVGQFQLQLGLFKKAKRAVRGR